MNCGNFSGTTFATYKFFLSLRSAIAHELTLRHLQKSIEQSIVPKRRQPHFLLLLRTPIGFPRISFFSRVFHQESTPLLSIRFAATAPTKSPEKEGNIDQASCSHSTHLTLRNS